MSNKKSKKIGEIPVGESVLGETISKPTDETIPVETTEVVLDAVVGTQEQVAAETVEKMTERLEDMAKKDTAGQVFSADIHAVGRDGQPSVTSSGKYRLKKGRKDALTDEDMQRKDVSETSAALFIQCGVSLFGDEWTPDNQKEFEHLTTAFDNYYKSVGVRYVPPSLGLVVALGGYSFKRFLKPETRTRIDKIKDVIKSRLIALFTRKKKTIQ